MVWNLACPRQCCEYSVNPLSERRVPPSPPAGTRLQPSPSMKIFFGEIPVPWSPLFQHQLRCSGDKCLESLLLWGQFLLCSISKGTWKTLKAWLLPSPGQPFASLPVSFLHCLALCLLLLFYILLTYVMCLWITGVDMHAKAHIWRLGTTFRRGLSLLTRRLRPAGLAAHPCPPSCLAGSVWGFLRSSLQIAQAGLECMIFPASANQVLKFTKMSSKLGVERCVYRRVSTGATESSTMILEWVRIKPLLSLMSSDQIKVVYRQHIKHGMIGEKISWCNTTPVHKEP